MERRVRWGLVGCGDIAERRVAPALKATGSLLAVAASRAERAAEFARRHEVPRSSGDWRDLVRDPEIDALYVATPVGLHPEPTIAAAEAGKHVLCEKPMALDPASCERMVAAARAHDVRLGVAYYRHHYPAVARLRAILASGEIGSPVLVHAQAFEAFDVAPDHPRAWFLRRADAGGGPMFDFGCHRLEVMLDLLGSVERVDGFPANVRFREREVEDTCVARLAFTRGAQGVLVVTHAARESRDTFELYGTEGSVHIPVLNKGTLRIVTPAGTREETHPPHANIHQPLIEDFAAAVIGGRAPTVTGEIGLAVARVIEAIYG
jgi:predicted dehydrogenase